MTYKTILTSKGTTTIPKEIRDQLGVKPGMFVTFTKNTDTGEYVLKRAKTISEIRSLNRAALLEAGTSNKEYQSGEGYSEHAKQNFGKYT